MHIRELQEGYYARRDWYCNKHSLCIGNINGVLIYFKNGVAQEEVRTKSSAYNYTDFVLCTREAKPIKEITMRYGEITHLVTTSDNCLKGFKSEKEALDYISDEFEANGKLKFTMFKAYQKIEPKRPSLADFITKIEE